MQKGYIRSLEPVSCVCPSFRVALPSKPRPDPYTAPGCQNSAACPRSKWKSIRVDSSRFSAAVHKSIEGRPIMLSLGAARCSCSLLAGALAMFLYVCCIYRQAALLGTRLKGAIRQPVRQSSTRLRGVATRSAKEPHSIIKIISPEKPDPTHKQTDPRPTTTPKPPTTKCPDPVYPAPGARSSSVTEGTPV